MEPSRFLSDIFPQEQSDLSWIPEGMDPSSSYRLAVHVGAYVKLLDDGSREYCNACNIPKILDRDSTNWNDVLGDITTEIKLGSNHKLRVTYWDKMSRSYEEITSDQILLSAIDMYWEIRRLSLQVCVMKKDEPDPTYDIGRQQSMPCVLLGSTDASQISVEPQLGSQSPTLEPPVQSSNEVAWVDDVVEYVGLDDEDPFKSLLTDSSDSEHGGLEDDIECDGFEDDLDVNDDIDCDGLEDDLVVEDACGCETIVHATDLENPTIQVGVTFGDGDTFKKAIRQYAIKGEYEIAARYSESRRYRGYCKAEDCKWTIHVSQLQDERTWMIKKIPEPHTCQSTGKVEKNSMATNHWVRDRVLDWLAKDPKIGPKALQKFEFKKAYGKAVKPMTDRTQWPQVNPGFKLWPPILKRAAGRPRVRRYKAAAEGGSGMRTTRCRRCKQLGHMQKTCNEFVYDSDAPPPAPPKPKRKKVKKTVTVVPSSDITTTVSTPPPQEVDVPFATPPRDIASITTSSPMTRSMTRRLQELEPSTPTRVITSMETPSPMTRSRKRMLELEGCIEPVACAHLSPVPVAEKGKAKKLKVVRSKI